MALALDIQMILLTVMDGSVCQALEIASKSLLMQLLALMEMLVPSVTLARKVFALESHLSANKAADLARLVYAMRVPASSLILVILHAMLITTIAPLMIDATVVFAFEELRESAKLRTLV